jgi:hypothetical protein
VLVSATAVDPERTEDVAAWLRAADVRTAHPEVTR